MVWTKREIEKYKFMSRGSNVLYANEGIFPEDPEARSKYLIRKINPSQRDYSTLKEIAEKNGEAFALIFFEKMVIQNFIKNHLKILS